MIVNTARANVHQPGASTSEALLFAAFSWLRRESICLTSSATDEPPLVSSIVEDHQVGVIVPVEELLTVQAQKWQILQKPPVFSLGNPIHDSEQKIIDAGKELLAKGADVIMLDCLGFNQRHRDLLQKQLDVTVLLSNVLIARLAAELLV